MNRLVLSGFLAASLLSTSGMASAEMGHNGQAQQMGSMDMGTSTMLQSMQHHQGQKEMMADWKNIQLVLNNEKVHSEIDSLWNNQENMAIVPLRVVAERLGAQVSWDHKEKMVSIDKEGLAIPVPMMNLEESMAIKINGTMVKLPFQMIKDRMMVPAPIISQLFGLDNRFNPVANTISFSNREDVPSFFTANEGGSISRVDAVTNKVMDTIKENGVVHNVQVSPDGKVLGATLIPSMGNMDHGHSNEQAMEMKGFALFFDISTNQLISRVEVGNHPAHIVFTQDGKYALVANNEDNTVSVIDAEKYQVVKTIPTGKNPHGFRISNDSKFAYIANMGEDSISVIDLFTLHESKKITVGKAPVTTGITTDGNTLVATLNAENAMAIVDLSTNKMVKIPVGAGPAQVYIEPDNKFAFVANQGTEKEPSHSVTKIDLTTKTVVATIETGKGSHGVTTSEDNKFVYVTNMFDDTVSVIDNQTNKVVSTIPVGHVPNGISFKK
ncbi:stalk domain-containing protein [Ammoniphilus resinae]|uniref:YVTN family beta-propeller protein n=1 Tax=Ammoniphilus resinae TaxID=861532 RepID=A0ABS4GLI2_9BACL|nr:cytochrome D1 domain-containing protein [Ammoniphilus resinae]MBP1931123.1 YVTN family beta-propeller protein [Ammoniphilus resinae]